jgi:hypothetical protein
MRSTQIFAFVAVLFMTIASQAQGWGFRDHRTYQGPTYQGPGYHGQYQGSTYRGPVYAHPIHPVFPIYHHVAPTTYWRTGHWDHSWHDNRFGWWWVNSLGWSFYASPVYPYPEPSENQTTIIYEPASQPPAAQYPPPATNTIVVTAPASTAPVPGNQTPPQNSGLYYFCESSQLYYPYARTCSERWKTVSQAPVD